MSKTIIKTVTEPSFSENTYLVYSQGSDQCAVIDPGLDPAAILHALENASLVPDAILCTHGHLDHIAGITELKRKFPNCPVYIGEKDADKFANPRGNLSADFGLAITVQNADKTVKHGDVVSAAGLNFEVREAPGHSAGHVVYLLNSDDATPAALFCGDVLFANSIGRSDFYDGDSARLIESIQTQILTLPDNTIVYSGHGPETTVGKERVYNPFF